MKGIPFQPWKVQAIIENPDKEWQTRRIGGLKEINKVPDAWQLVNFDQDKCHALFRYKYNREVEEEVKSRYPVGEIVYIEEAWATENQFNHLKPSEIPHTAQIFYTNDSYDPFTMGKVRSPLFLPTWTARSFIQITGVGIGRLQGISWQDCLKEGVIEEQDTFYPFNNKQVGYSVPQGAFAYLWDSINPKHPWVKNEWVFIFSFLYQPEGRKNKALERCGIHSEQEEDGDE